MNSVGSSINGIRRCQGTLLMPELTGKALKPCFAVLENDDLRLFEPPSALSSPRNSSPRGTNGQKEILHCNIRFSTLRMINSASREQQQLSGFSVLLTADKSHDFYVQNVDDLSVWLEHLKSYCFLVDFKKVYRIEKTLKNRAKCKIKLLRHRVTNQYFIGKFISKEKLLSHPQNLAMTKNEIKCFQQLRHPKILRMAEFYKDESSMILVLDYMEGGTLYDRVSKLKRRYNEAETAKLLKDLMEALVCLGEFGIIHRDIKLENIFVPDSNDDCSLKLGDFDISGTPKDLEKNRNAGTVGYLAPEMFHKGENLTTKTDIYSAGIVLYILLAGTSAFKAGSHDEMFKVNKAGKIDFEHPKLMSGSQDARNLLISMLKVKPEERPSAADVLAHPFLKLAENIKPKIASQTAQYGQNQPSLRESQAGRRIDSNAQALSLREESYDETAIMRNKAGSVTRETRKKVAKTLIARKNAEKDKMYAKSSTVKDLGPRVIKMKIVENSEVEQEQNLGTVSKLDGINAEEAKDVVTAKQKGRLQVNEGAPTAKYISPNSNNDYGDDAVSNHITQYSKVSGNSSITLKTFYRDKQGNDATSVNIAKAIERRRSMSPTRKPLSTHFNFNPSHIVGMLHANSANPSGDFHSAVGDEVEEDGSLLASNMALLHKISQGKKFISSLRNKKKSFVRKTSSVSKIP